MELIYIVLAFLLCRLVVSVVATISKSTGQPTEGLSDEEDWPDDSSPPLPSASWDDGTAPFPSSHAALCINPATGLPMLSGDAFGIDCGGNPFGTDLFDHSTGIDTAWTDDAFSGHDPIDGSWNGGFD